MIIISIGPVKPPLSSHNGIPYCEPCSINEKLIKTPHSITNYTHNFCTFPPPSPAHLISLRSQDFIRNPPNISNTLNEKGKAYKGDLVDSAPVLESNTTGSTSKSINLLKNLKRNSNDLNSKNAEKEKSLQNLAMPYKAVIPIVNNKHKRVSG